MGFVPPHEMVYTRLGSHSLPYCSSLTVGLLYLLPLVLERAPFVLIAQIADQAHCIYVVVSAVFSLTAVTALN